MNVTALECDDDYVEGTDLYVVLDVNTNTNESVITFKGANEWPFKVVMNMIYLGTFISQ